MSPRSPCAPMRCSPISTRRKRSPGSRRLHNRNQRDMIELPFARGEYEQRLKKIRAEMQKRNLELLIVNDIANQHYITAYDGWSFYTPQIVLVPVEDEEPVWIGRAMDAAGGLLTA